MAEYIFDSTSPEVERLAEICKNSSTIDPRLYTEYKVYRGLRAPDGSGVSCRRGDASFGFSSDGIDRKQCPQLNTFGAGGCEGCEGCEGWAC